MPSAPDNVKPPRTQRPRSLGRALAVAVAGIVVLAALVVIELEWGRRAAQPQPQAPSSTRPAVPRAHAARPAPLEAAPRAHLQEPQAAQSPPPAEVPPSAEPAPPSGLDLYDFDKKPIKVGLVVPDDFALPPGYVRHIQVTNDGVRLPPILMFDPDSPPRGENGEPLPITEDRIVPPELAPKGMPIEWLEVPQPPEAE